MIFKSITIHEHNYSRTIDFVPGNNLIFSIHNSKGKTTLLRMLLYGIGYNIPNTRKIRFENCKIITDVISDDGSTYQLTREHREYLTICHKGQSETYALPGEENELHRKIFNIENPGILSNLLGSFYFDQEKGWTLLNRGTVIGSIHFSIEELIRGLGNIDCQEYEAELQQLSKNLKKFEEMFSVSKYQESLDIEQNNLVSEDFNEEIEKELNLYRIERKRYKDQLTDIDKALNENKSVKYFVDKMKLIVQTENGELVMVCSDNIVGLNDSIDYLINRKKILATEYNKIANAIEHLENKKTKEEQQLSLFNDIETISEIFDKQICSLPMDQKAINKNIKNTKKEINSIHKRITELTKTANHITTSIYNNVKRFLDTLNLDTEKIKQNDIFTSDLQSLSGAILHNNVFALRLACLKEIEKQMNIHLPIILDSPRGKEIDDQNIDNMMKILKEEFKDNQIIIASIFEYNLENVNKIELKDRVVE